MRTAKTAEELRAAQAILLPLELGMSLEETAKVIGRSVRATCSLRTRYYRIASGEETLPRTKRDIRNRVIATLK